MKQQRRHYSAEEKAKSSLEAISCQQRATLEKRNAPEKRKSGDAVVRPSCRSSLLRDPGAKFLVETGHPNRTMKNSLNYVSTCLKVVDTRRRTQTLLLLIPVMIPLSCLHFISVRLME